MPDTVLKHILRPLNHNNPLSPAEKTEAESGQIAANHKISVTNYL
jgi:hypothetical protein